MKDKLPNLIGGSADLAPSNKTNMSGEGDFSKATPEGRNLHFGVRELAMTAIGNGLMRTVVCGLMWQPSSYSVIT